jgi:NADP-dependent 3-hydroxy acid dehydrogenase YdfG
MTNYENLHGRTALVTGAASGMGEATARLLAASGARVVLLARRLERLTEITNTIIGDGGTALAVAADVTDEAQVDRAAAEVHRAYGGRIDLLVNAAGVMLPNPIEAGRADEWQRMIDTNLTGALRVVRAFVPDLVAAAAEGGAADLVNISSIGAHVLFPNYAVYGATKAALTLLGDSLRTELGPKNVRVTTVEPGLTRTELGGHIDNVELTEQLRGMFEEIGPLSAAEVAEVVAFAVSRPEHMNLSRLVVVPTRQA